MAAARRCAPSLLRAPTSRLALPCPCLSTAMHSDARCARGAGAWASRGLFLDAAVPRVGPWTGESPGVMPEGDDQHRIMAEHGDVCAPRLPQIQDGFPLVLVPHLPCRGAPPMASSLHSPFHDAFFTHSELGWYGRCPICRWGGPNGRAEGGGGGHPDNKKRWSVTPQ